MLNIIKNKDAWLYLVPVLLVAIFIRKALSDITVSLLALFFVFYVVKNKYYYMLNEPWLKMSLIFFAYLILSALMSKFPQDALIQSFIFIRWPLFAAALYFIVLNNERNLDVFERTAIFFLLFIVSDTIFQLINNGDDIFGRHYLDGVNRPTGPFVKPVAGVYSLKVFFFAFLGSYLWLKNKKKESFTFITIFYLAVVAFLLSTGERIVFLLSVMGLLLWLSVLVYSRPYLMKYIVIIIGAGVALLAVVFKLNTSSLERMREFTQLVADFSQSAYGKIFHSAYEVWLTQPWVGVGMRMYTESCDSLNLSQISNYCTHHPHNIYLEVLSQNGVLGLIIFICMLFAIFKPLLKKQVWQHDYFIAAILFSSVLVIFWPLASSMSVFANNYGGPVWLTIAWALSRARWLEQKTKLNAL